jgi:hypothetical protein
MDCERGEHDDADSLSFARHGVGANKAVLLRTLHRGAGGGLKESIAASRLA